MPRSGRTTGRRRLPVPRPSRARAAPGACSSGSACPRRRPSRGGTDPRGRSGAATGRRHPGCPRRPRSPPRLARRRRPPPRAGAPARAGRRSGTRSGTRTRARLGSITSPVDFRRNSRRSSMYASPRRRAAATSAEPPIARSCSSRPSTTLIVVPNDDTVAPFSTSQFQPPSGSCSPSSRSTSGATSTPKYEPVATTLPLMHGSTSPSKKRLSAHGVSNSGSRQITCSCTSAIARRAGSLAGIEPEPPEQLQRVEGVRPVVRPRPAAPLAVARLERQQPRAPALGRDPRSFGGDAPRRLVREVAHRLPTDGWIGFEQPVDNGHLGSFGWAWSLPQGWAVYVTSSGRIASLSGGLEQRGGPAGDFGPAGRTRRRPRSSPRRSGPNGRSPSAATPVAPETPQRPRPGPSASPRPRACRARSASRSPRRPSLRARRRPGTRGPRARTRSNRGS